MGAGNGKIPITKPTVSAETINQVNLFQLQFLKGHSDTIESVLAIDSAKFASASKDGLILIWSTETGILLQVLEGHNGSVKVMLLFKEDMLITGGSDTTIRVWDVREGLCLHTLEGHEGCVTSIIRNVNDGFISACNNGMIIIWTSKFEKYSVIDLNKSTQQIWAPLPATARRSSSIQSPASRNSPPLSPLGNIESNGSRDALQSPPSVLSVANSGNGNVTASNDTNVCKNQITHDKIATKNETEKTKQHEFEDLLLFETEKPKKRRVEHLLLFNSNNSNFESEKTRNEEKGVAKNKSR
ncbi:hypothetical protein RFI_24176 [Reticulomyxa filosa]|uniref:Uncharacterized protein n=1 Tax=Reticulomyxa filosa TaxID=46433 RepID=X6MJF6_RETFI|nr:hypothetical protein RFI_24176 [Reticulomyxa filosa]|eukprot:ETO13200.1 hypothetical protein RFI_24176 [Reticulomyxa filosa]